ncbi:MAG: hypothetical protein C0418_03575 [Coriobacteriaceae bacterium]|nr:hypothetical protein [Coriobacteriaceae bacterium]
MGGPMDTVRVFLIGRRTMCMEGLAAILSTCGSVSIVGRAHEWTEGLTRAKALDSDVVVVDMVHCPECGPATAASCVKELEDANVVILGVPGGDTTVVDALQAGALGFLSLDQADPDTVCSTVLAAARGEAAIDPRISSAVLARMRNLSQAVSTTGPHDASPTQREAQVLELLVKGCSNRQISVALHVSENTVKNHLHAIYAKLGAESRTQAVSEAIRRGLVSQ